MIHDPQLEELFRAESEERLARLDSGLLTLEHSPGDRGLLEELFREIHSLKGAARMLKLERIEDTAHGMESLFNTALREALPLNPQAIASLDAALKKIRREIDEVLAPARPPAKARGAPPPKTDAGKPFQIETVRVETAKLDDLLALAGELGVLRGRSQHHQALMAQVLEHWALVERSRRWSTLGLAGTGESLLARFGDLLRAAQEGLQEDANRFDSTLASLQERIQSARLLPLSVVFKLFPRMVLDLGKAQGKEVDFRIEGADITLDKHILEEIKDPLMHLLRNAVCHGIEPPTERVGQGKPTAGLIRVAATRDGSHITLTVSDDGRGLNPETIRRAALERGLFDAATLADLPPEELHQLVLAPGFSTDTQVTELSGRGIGLDVVSTRIASLKGTVRLDSFPGRGTTASLRLPVSLSTLRLLLLHAGGRIFGLPVDSIRALHRLPRDAFYTVDGRTTVDIDGQPLLAPALARLLELPGPGASPDASGAVTCAVVQVEDQALILQVDDILAEEEVIPRPLGPPLKRVRNLESLALLGGGDLCPILNPADLLRAAVRLRAAPARSEAGQAVTRARPAVLLVEDSALVRAMEKRIIEDAGYEVTTAVDGVDALAKLGTGDFSAIVSDIHMPNLDGLSLTARLREEERYRSLPVILVSALDSGEDKRRGLEVGASAYLPKPAFDQRALVEALKRLIGS